MVDEGCLDHQFGGLKAKDFWVEEAGFFLEDWLRKREI